MSNLDSCGGRMPGAPQNPASASAIEPLHDRIRAAAALAAASGAEAQVVGSLSERNWTRFANSHITQNTTNESRYLSATLARSCGRRGPGASQDPAGAATGDPAYRVIHRATGAGEPEPFVRALAADLDRAPRNGEFKGFAPPLPAAGVPTFHAATAGIGLPEKAALVKRIVDGAPDLTVGGILETAVETVITVNTNGVDRLERFTEVMADVKYENAEGGTASFQWTGRDLAAFPLDRLAAAAAGRARANVGRKPLPDGAYPVLLSPSAVSEFLYFLSHLAFGGREFKQKRSLVAGKLGTALFANERITITDDPHDPLTLTANYDDEGMPKKPLVLVERGIARAVAHNLLTADALVDPTHTALAASSGAPGLRPPQESTGHAIGSMAYPMLMTLAPGDADFGDLLRTTERALLISRLHYPTIDNPDRIILKGSTKDGTFLAERGRLSACDNLEFIVEIPRLFERIERLAADLETLPQGSLASGLPGANRVPGVLTSPLAVVNGILTLIG